MVHSVEELSLLVEDTREAGMLSSAQAEFVRKVFRLSGKEVGDCMVPRERMGALPWVLRPTGCWSRSGPGRTSGCRCMTATRTTSSKW